MHSFWRNKKRARKVERVKRVFKAVLDPNNPIAQCDLGALQCELGELKDAEESQENQ